MSKTSSSGGSGKILKPSEVKALAAKKAMAKRSSSSTNSGEEMGAQGVLRQIAEMRAKLGASQSMIKVKNKTESALLDVCDELLKTEGNYLRDVQFTCDKYLVPLQAVADHKEHGAVFSNLQQLLGMHELLQKDLEPAAAASSRDDKAEKIAMAFKKIIPFFKMYSLYSHSYASAGTHLMELKEGKKAARDLIEAAEGDEGPFLEALLFRPVQRMCVYPLLFKQALKHVEEGTPLHAKLTEVFDSVQVTIMEVNEKVRKQAELDRTADVLLSEVGGDVAELLSASRTLSHEADVDMKQASGRSMLNPEWKIRRSYRWYLLSDQLLICRPNRTGTGRGGSMFHKKVLIPLDELVLLTDSDEVSASAMRSFQTGVATAAVAPGGGGGGGGASPRGRPSLTARALASFPVGGSRRKLSMAAVEKARRSDGDLNEVSEEVSVVEELGMQDRSNAFAHGHALHADGDMGRNESIGTSSRTTSAPVKSSLAGRFGFGKAKAKAHEAEAEANEPDKPEVLRIRWTPMTGGHDSEYKCWAESGAARDELIGKIRALQLEREQLLYRLGKDEGVAVISSGGRLAGHAVNVS